MPVKIRLQRHGKKGAAFFHIVIADGRAPRDGKFIEKIGTYNPTTNPATINLDADKALSSIAKSLPITPLPLRASPILMHFGTTCRTP